VPSSWQNYDLQCHTVAYMLCYVRLNTEPGLVVQAILAHGGPEVIFDDFIDFTFLDKSHGARSCENIPPQSIPFSNLE